MSLLLNVLLLKDFCCFSKVFFCLGDYLLRCFFSSRQRGNQLNFSPKSFGVLCCESE